MKTITLLNEKGGVGKTTLAIHIAAGLAIRGKRVVLVDVDPQGSATISLGHKTSPKLHDLLVRYEGWENVLEAVEAGRYSSDETGNKGELYLVPGNIETRAVPMLIDDALVIYHRLEELDGLIDVVVFDTPPTPSLLHGAIYLATDTILYPVIPEYLSLAGLMASTKHQEAAQNRRKQIGLSDLKVGGIIPNLYHKRHNAHDFIIKQLFKQFGNKVWGAMPERTVIKEASIDRQTLFAYAPEHEATELAWRLVGRTEQVMAS